jgi:hypothetical protein
VLVHVLDERREQQAVFFGALATQKLPDDDEREDQGDPEQDRFMALSQYRVLSTGRDRRLPKVLPPNV